MDSMRGGMKGSTVKWKPEVYDYSNDPPDSWFSTKLAREIFGGLSTDRKRDISSVTTAMVIIPMEVLRV
ncbi:hypothetical protein K0M31_003828 [Melipona bicolor]|uniref:Uncharacterized protein n=1 Tax=Melipona bicolor TaxID=60889 RepID=A0AA40FXM0_9HYME|nr:hypothetical protein K0M31_003828 [Melipona bicolor]